MFLELSKKNPGRVQGENQLKKPVFVRHPANPIVTPGLYPWRRACVFNPAVIHEDGLWTMYERASGGLTPFHCQIGMLESRDGVRFRHASDKPVLTPGMCGSRHGSVQDPRIVKIGQDYLMTFAYRPFAWNCWPTGVGVPDSEQAVYPEFDGDPKKNQTRSGVAISRDRKSWKIAGWVNDPETDDRDVVLFPEKINGRYCVLRRPLPFVDTAAKSAEAHPSLCISYSDDLTKWTSPKPIVLPAFAWESNRIGASTPPLKTPQGWLVFYHGVETTDPSLRAVIYRTGVLMLDLLNPEKIIARPPEFVFEPQEYYEKFGLYIPNVVFPTASPVVDETVHLYYGVCDTAICLATVRLEDLIEYALGGI